ncbi:MAG: DeoR/GlpR family DNA-binding transcription regulator [Anaerolineae bacterium]
MFPEERQRKILSMLDRHGRVSVNELSDRFDVSAVTIRADLQALAEAGTIVRTHGGAIPGDRGLRFLSLSRRLAEQVAEKQRIGQHGAQLVSDGEAVFIDSSSTALALARNLKRHRELTIITNALAVAQEMLEAPEVTVLLLGGRLRQDTASLVDPGTMEAQLDGLNVQKGFFGAHGVDISSGLTDVSIDEADVKRSLVHLGLETIAVVDGTKWGRVGLASFARLEQVDRIITDAAAPADALERVRALGVDVISV